MNLIITSNFIKANFWIQFLDSGIDINKKICYNFSSVIVLIKKKERRKSDGKRSCCGGNKRQIALE